MYTRVAPFCLPLELRGHLHSMYYISAACSLGFVVQVGLAAVEGAIQNSSMLPSPILCMLPAACCCHLLFWQELLIISTVGSCNV